MTATQTRKPIVMPYNPSITNISVQDIINHISGNVDPDDDEQKAAIAYLEQSSYEDRIHIADIITNQETGHRHMIEGIADQVHADTIAELSAIAQGEEELPELGPFTLWTVNQSRLRRNLTPMRLMDMTGPDPEIVSKLLVKLIEAPMEQQEGIEHAIRDAITEHGSRMEALKQEIFSTIQDRLKQVMEQ